jgi:hypothetical protein
VFAALTALPVINESCVSDPAPPAVAALTAAART